MITVNEAKAIIQNTIQPKIIGMELEDCDGLVLAHDLYTPHDLPFFDNAAMDGYAIKYADIEDFNSINLSHLIIAAGSQLPLSIEKNQAFRIFTGARIPDGADTVIEQELVEVDINNFKISVEKEKIYSGKNVRLRGSELIEGGLLLPKGSKLTPAAVGLLSASGIHRLSVFKRPVVSLIITGSELTQPGEKLQYGHIFESNSFMLKAALEKDGILDITIYRVEDNMSDIIDAINDAKETADFIILTGGVSVGDYDFVQKASLSCGFKEQFHKIKQKPGKPLLFAAANHQYLFGLPGNPGSALTCYYIYVQQALSIFFQKALSRSISTIFNGHFSKKAGLTQFLKGKFDGNSVMDLAAHESYKLMSFAVANCLIEIEENLEELKMGDPVKIHLIPN